MLVLPMLLYQIFKKIFAVQMFGHEHFKYVLEMLERININ